MSAQVVASDLRPGQPRASTTRRVAYGSSTQLELTVLRLTRSTQWLRIEAALGGTIHDAVPVALWCHFPGSDRTPEGLTHVHVEAQQARLFPDNGAACQPVAGGAVSVQNGLGSMFSASTRVQWCGRGAQTALISARLAVAATAGCDLIGVDADPGSPSQRNLERCGFQVVYNRLRYMPGSFTPR